MPNHVINILSFEGDKTKIRQMLEDIKDDEHGLHSVDFNKIIPMPPSLDLEASSRTQAGLAAYKDFIDVYTLGGTINTEHLSDIPVASEQRFLKVRTDINHEDFALGKQAWNIRTADVIERSIKRISMYSELDTIKINTSNKSVPEVVNEIKSL